MVRSNVKKKGKVMELRKELFKLADEEYKKFHSSLCPSVDNIIGVRLPKLREIAKKISKENPIEFLNNYKCEYYEEKMVYGLVIGYMKAKLDEYLKYLDIFVPMIDNWAVCDACTATLKFTNKNREAMWNYIQKYLNSNQEFEVRFAVIMMMDYFLTDEYVDKVLEEYEKIHLDKYYVKMGIAWGISVAFVKHEEKTRTFLQNNALDKETFNKAIQKIIESNRVSKEVKDEMRRMKRK